MEKLAGAYEHGPEKMSPDEITGRKKLELTPQRIEANRANAKLAGREPIRSMAMTRKFRELMQTDAFKAAEYLLEIAKNGKPDATRLEAIKIIFERGYGKIETIEANVAASAHVTVITGVRG